jgi:hypothetical protein
MQIEPISTLAERLISEGKVEPADALAIRRAIYSHDGRVDRSEAEALFGIEHARRGYCAEWSQIFVEALTDYTIKQEPPEGYLSDANAAWIMAQIKRRKEPSTDGDLALVANLIENSREVPAAFSAFALRLVKETVIYGDGPDAMGRPHGAGRVTEADAAMLRRILWGAGSEGLLAVSREEAEALVAIADATTGADNVSDFDDLFARAIGNYLIGATGRPVPKREDALRWETSAEYKTDVVAALSRVLSSAPQALDPGFMLDTLRNARTLSEDVEAEHERRNHARDIAIDVAAIMTPEKAGWLLEHVNKNGLMNEPEKALVRFIAREAESLDPSLNTLINKGA